jgi:hypothetical protein
MLAKMTVFSVKRSVTSVMIHAKVWNMGRMRIPTSLRSRVRRSRAPSALETRLRCVSITPLGKPVVPLV